MYCPDTFKRLNAAAEKKYINEVKKGKVDCEYCNDKKATVAIPIYNPADSIRGVEGAVTVAQMCEECYEDGRWQEDVFTCGDCGKEFITNHSWDNLTVVVDGEMYCHECGLKHIEQRTIADVIDALKSNDTSMFVRVNAPDKATIIWEGEYSGYSDFPGHTSLNTIVNEIEEACETAGIDINTYVIPAVTHTYQFSCALAIFELVPCLAAMAKKRNRSKKAA